MEVETAKIVVVADGVVSGLDEQKAKQAVALFGDVAEALGVAAGVFARIEAAVSGDAACAVETRDGIERMDHGERSERADAGVRAQARDARIVLRAPFEFVFDGLDLLGQGNE